jgi:hypothetical protein
VKPLVYIAAVRRTGSTMMTELLSDPPACFVFREPRLPLGRLQLAKRDEPRRILREFGVRVEPVSKRMRSLPPREAIRVFRQFCEESQDRIHQFGVKEIRHEGWERVGEEFPDMKVVITVRDPRDIFLSMWHRRDTLEQRHRRWMEPEVLAEDVNRESRRLERIAERHDHIVVRYEDICRHPERIDEVRRFTDSTAGGVGLLGRAPTRDTDLHGAAVDSSRVELWKREQDPEVIALYREAYRLMESYAVAWGYA